MAFRRNVSSLSLVPNSPRKICGLDRPEGGGKTILRYLGNYLAYLIQDINI